MSKTHQVAKGDCLESIAKQYGFGDYKVIYNHPQNADLKRKRPKPNLLAVGDKVFIPDKNLGEEPCATDQKHHFQIVTKKVKLRVVVKDDKGEFFADKKYELKIGSLTFEGNTDGRGFIEQEIPANAKRGVLKVFTEDEKLKVLTWHLAIGSLGPVEVDYGVQGRLKNLGFYGGSIDGRVNDKKTKDAIEAYQSKNSMTPDGEADDELRGKLRDTHDEKS